MSTITKSLAGILGVICLLFSHQAWSQVYRNGPLSVRVDLFTLEGGGDWGFRSLVPGFDVSFSYKGHHIQIPSGKVSEKRFSRKEYPVPSDFTLSDSEVMLDGFPVANYMAYKNYMSGLGDEITTLTGNVDRGSKDALNKVLKEIDSKIAEIKSKSTSFQVSSKFSNRENADGYIEKLVSQREHFAGELERLEKKQGSSTLVVSGNSPQESGSGNTPSKSNESKNTVNDDFWSDGTNGSNQKTKTNTVSDGDVYERDESFVADSKFKNNLNGVKDGEYFTDEAGNHYQKKLGGAKKVDKATYDRHAANKIYAQMERREADRQQRDAAFKQNWDNISTSFYVMSATKQGMQDASDLSGHFESIEELNASFSQKMREISEIGNAMQQASTQGIQAYSGALSSASSGYDYSGVTNAIGAIGSAISANNAEKKAREELRAQRAEQEASIKERQLKALVAIRDEIGEIFAEGGMPVSSDKITAPVLYLFAHGSNKADWYKNQSVAMALSNVIPVYRYSDGTYPYTSNVKRTFENAGISNPVLVGYFTDKNEAEKYRSSLLEIAPNAKFAINDVAVKVKEQALNTNAVRSSSVDFWGTKITDSKTQNTNNKQTETDFWAVPVKDQKAESKHSETTKQNDFWNK